MSGFFSGFDCGWKKFGKNEIKTSEIIGVSEIKTHYDEYFIIHLRGGSTMNLYGNSFREFEHWWKEQRALEE